MRLTYTARKCLLLASLSLPSARQLASVAAEREWDVFALDECSPRVLGQSRTFYGGTDRAAEYAARYELCLIEPPLDLITGVPAALRARAVQFGRLSQLSRLVGPVFVKPADPISKVFDAGVYPAVAAVRGRRPLDPNTNIIVSEPVEWTSEFRCFMSDGRIEAWSPYLSFGRPTWKPSCAGALPRNLETFCERLVAEMGAALPPAFVVDIGVLGDGRWAVVEFNPAWCSGILGANVEGALRMIERSALWSKAANPDDRRWSRLG